MSYADIPVSPPKKDEYRQLPLKDWAECFQDGAPYFADFLNQAKDRPHWQAVDMRSQLNNINVPMLHAGPWYDVFQYDALTTYGGLREQAMVQEARHN